MSFSKGFMRILQTIGSNSWCLAATSATAAFKFTEAAFATEIEVVTVHIGAVIVAFRWLLAAMALTNNLSLFVANRHRQTIVEYK